MIFHDFHDFHDFLVSNLIKNKHRVVCKIVTRNFHRDRTLFRSLFSQLSELSSYLYELCDRAHVQNHCACDVTIDCY